MFDDHGMGDETSMWHRERQQGDGGGMLARLGLARDARDRRTVEPLLAMRERAAREGLLVLRVTEVREVGVRGTKAWVELDDGTRLDSWFWAAEPDVECFLLVRACVREGTHTGDDVCFVGRGTPLEPGIVDTLPRKVTAAARRLDVLHAPDGRADARHAA